MSMPEGWKSLLLKDILDGTIRNGYSPIPSNVETGFWILGLGAIGDERINISEIKPVFPSDKVKTNILNPDDFLVTRSNTPDKVGRSIRFQGEVVNCAYPDLMMRFRINKKIADVNFVEFYLKYPLTRSYFTNSASGSSGTMVKITKSVLEKTPIILPTVPEQQKIAKILFTWDQAITTCEQLLANSQQQKKALMQQLLTGKKRLLDDNGVRFSGEWNTSRLGDLSSIDKGKQLNRSGLLKEGTYPVINGGVEPSGYTDMYNCEENNITISEGGNSCGFVAFQRRRFWCGGHCYVINIESLNLDFSYHMLKYEQSNIMSLRVGSGLPNIQKKALENFIVVFPSAAEEQQKIAAALTTADREIEGLQTKIAALKQEKKALMQQLLTGKRRVVIDPAQHQPA